MAWQNETVTMLRLLIDDISEPYTYETTRLEQVLGLSARLVLGDAESFFDNSYEVEMCPVSITPDPIDDKIFIDLTVLKAACFIDLSEARQAAKNSGFVVREFSSTIDTKGLADARFKILEVGFCKSYKDALRNFQSGQYSAGHAILSPFRTCYSDEFLSRRR